MGGLRSPFIDACIANDPRAYNGSPDFQDPAAHDLIISYAAIDKLNLTNSTELSRHATQWVLENG